MVDSTVQEKAVAYPIDAWLLLKSLQSLVRLARQNGITLRQSNARAPGGQFVLGAMACPGNPYDGHTLKDQLEQTARLTGAAVRRTYVDRGYRGHDAAEDTDVFIARQKRGLTPTIKRELKRQNAIEPVIGHIKNDGHLGRSYLKGAEGDAVNVMLAAAGHNLRLLARWLLLCRLWKFVHRIWDDSKTVPMAA